MVQSPCMDQCSLLTGNESRIKLWWIQIVFCVKVLAKTPFIQPGTTNDDSICQKLFFFQGRVSRSLLRVCEFLFFTSAWSTGRLFRKDIHIWGGSDVIWHNEQSCIKYYLKWSKVMHLYYIVMVAHKQTNNQNDVQCKTSPHWDVFQLNKNILKVIVWYFGKYRAYWSLCSNHIMPITSELSVGR